ncbi:haloacid dehalogenase type II [Acetobacter lambici]|uniref:Haloacid dehalogenase type II n=1 Tax=Acetobacter lambici TaxID=1332824 RepID=A0ABT1F4V4_9PROT|nr:haloacid dehalogenase type II [Acetobacter lambici]MCP1242499.1 haloacid dehalogenase type II [Acetobacter lambici]MCP1258749.1 haloacid dehalogenase type II [Acetobacter lambici]NHO57056.1 haloacid dehalogenase type II [Acetobacter lambici]
MTTFRPKFVTFDCYGTLTRFRMSDMARELYADVVPPEGMEQFCKDFAAYRLDEVLGPWQPYRYVLLNAMERTCKKWNVPFAPEVANKFYEAVPTWGPWDDVPAGLSKVAKEVPLVILSNASNTQIHSNVAKLGAPVHAVFTAEDAQAYKPHMRAFEYMLDKLGCGPEDILHVSSSLRYDLMTAHDLGIRNKVFVARGHEPSTPYYGYTEIPDIGGLPGVLGL